MNAVDVNETSTTIMWHHSATCFEDCDITFNFTWAPSHQAHIHQETVETMATVYHIMSLKPDTAYKATLTALCLKQSQVVNVSETVNVAFRTLSGVCIYMHSPAQHKHSIIKYGSSNMSHHYLILVVLMQSKFSWVPFLIVMLYHTSPECECSFVANVYRPSWSEYHTIEPSLLQEPLDML